MKQLKQHISNFVGCVTFPGLCVGGGGGGYGRQIVPEGSDKYSFIDNQV